MGERSLVDETAVGVINTRRRTNPSATLNKRTRRGRIRNTKGSFIIKMDTLLSKNKNQLVSRTGSTTNSFPKNRPR